MLLTVSGIWGQKKSDTVMFRDHLDSLSYITGRDVGAQLKELEANIRLNAFSRGIEQALNGVKSDIDSVQADSIRRQFSQEVQEKMMQKQQAEAEDNAKKGESFLAENKKRADVKTTQSGLQYIITRKGKGPKPSMQDSVRVLYKGMLLDSTVFDSTPNSNPAVLDLQKIIPGLTEGILLMSVGSTYRFFLPAELAYGPQGAPPTIPPNATLIFEVSLIDIISKETKSRF
jgi:FKBP-type peptidyl-prolyl cis-trans isomerase